MPRQDGHLTENSLIEEIRFSGHQAQRVVIDEFHLHQRLKIDPEKRGIDPGIFNGLKTKQHVLPGQLLAILEMRITAYAKGIRQFILADLRSRGCELGTEFQCLRLVVEEVFENRPQDTCSASIVTRQGIELLGIAENV